MAQGPGESGTTPELRRSTLRRARHWLLGRPRPRPALRALPGPVLPAGERSGAEPARVARRRQRRRKSAPEGAGTGAAVGRPRPARLAVGRRRPPRAAASTPRVAADGAAGVLLPSLGTHPAAPDRAPPPGRAAVPPPVPPAAVPLAARAGAAADRPGLRPGGSVLWGAVTEQRPAGEERVSPLGRLLGK